MSVPLVGRKKKKNWYALIVSSKRKKFKAQLNDPMVQSNQNLASVLFSVEW